MAAKDIQEPGSGVTLTACTAGGEAFQHTRPNTPDTLPETHSKRVEKVIP